MRRAIALFACVYLTHGLMPVSTQGDSRWTIPTALSFIHGRGGDLRDYARAIEASGFYATECVEQDGSRRFPLSSLNQCAAGRLYNYHPIAVSLVAIPFVDFLETSLRIARPFLAPIADRGGRVWLSSFIAGDLAGCSTIIENLISALFTAGAVAALYLAALEFLPAAPALALSLTFAFGTLLWSLVSRALWQHSPSVFLNSLLILLLVRGRNGRRTWIATGFVLALAFFIRPTNAVPVVVIGAYCFWRFRSSALWLIAGGLPLTICMVLLNLHMYGKVLAPFFFVVRENSTSLAFHSSFALALLSNLISPARGLFVFMPFLLLLALPQVWREPMPVAFRVLRPWFCAVIVLHMLLVASHVDWWGGFSYGPRYLSDILPYLMFLWAPVLLWMVRDLRRLALVSTLLVASLGIHFRGATSIAVHQWNSTPVSVNTNTSRIWDWTDIPYLRGILK